MPDDDHWKALVIAAGADSAPWPDQVGVGAELLDRVRQDWRMVRPLVGWMAEQLER